MLLYAFAGGGRRGGGGEEEEVNKNNTIFAKLSILVTQPPFPMRTNEKCRHLDVNIEGKSFCICRSKKGGPTLLGTKTGPTVVVLQIVHGKWSSAGSAILEALMKVRWGQQV
jgi:hypothetical protein